MNLLEGFRRLFVVLSVAVLLTAAASDYRGHTRPFLKDFVYAGGFGYGAGASWTPSPEWLELKSQVVGAVDAGYLSDDQAIAALDDALSPEPRATDSISRAVNIVIVDLQASYDAAAQNVAFDRIAARPATHPDGEAILGDRVGTTDSQPIDGLRPLIEARFAGRPLPVDFEQMEPDARRDLIQALHVKDALQSLNLPDRPVVPLYQRVDWKPFYNAAALIAMLWFLYGAGVYIARGFSQSPVSAQVDVAPKPRGRSKTTAL